MAILQEILKALEWKSFYVWVASSHSSIRRLVGFRQQGVVEKLYDSHRLRTVHTIDNIQVVHENILEIST